MITRGTKYLHKWGRAERCCSLHVTVWPETQCGWCVCVCTCVCMSPFGINSQINDTVHVCSTDQHTDRHSLRGCRSFTLWASLLTDFGTRGLWMNDTGVIMQLCTAVDSCSNSQTQLYLSKKRTLVQIFVTKKSSRHVFKKRKPSAC